MGFGDNEFENGFDDFDVGDGLDVQESGFAIPQSYNVGSSQSGSSEQEATSGGTFMQGGNSVQGGDSVQGGTSGGSPQGRPTQNLDPNVTVQRPQNRHHINYNQQAQSGARQARTEEVTQGFSQPGQSIQRNVQGQPVRNPQQRPSQGVVNQQQRQQAQRRQQTVNSQQRQQAVNSQQMQNTRPVQQHPVNTRQAKSKKGFGKVIGAVAVIGAVVGVVAMIKSGFITIGKEPLVAQVENYDSSGRAKLDSLVDLLNADEFDAVAIDSLVGSEEGDSYIAQEWAYINGVKLREEFVKRVCSLVKFEYPMVSQLSTSGVEMVDSSGQPIMTESMMNNGESVTVTIPDYDAITAMMDADDDVTGRKYILRMFKSSGYTESDYTWHDEMANLLMQYLCDLDEIPTKTVQINIPVSGGTITDDSQLDDALFGSSEFHNMCAKYSQICMGWTGFKKKKYMAKEEQHNPEYDRWLDLFLKYFQQDGGKYNPVTGKFSGGHFHKATSKWEPWYLRDDKDNFIRDEKGNKIVNYYSVKKKDGTDWIQPSETVLVDVEKVKKVDDPWVEETAIQYNIVGTNWIQKNYTGVGETAFRVGDGSKDSPAGIGTTIITKALCTDGKYHDVKVAVLGYWIDQDAIDYAEKFSTKNRGFTTTSVISLITYEVQIENLENKTITLADSEMSLCDDNSNISARTGVMYGFTGVTKIKPHEKVIINDWASSTELDQKYVIWGKDFGRNYSMVYFNILAGTGDIPTYSAYKQFTGQSAIDENVKVDVVDEAYQKALDEANGVDSSSTEESDTSDSE